MSELISGCCINLCKFFLLTRTYLGVEFSFPLCPFGVRWWPHIRVGWRCQNLKVSESQFLTILFQSWKCQNLKESEPESVRIWKCQSWIVSKCSETGTCHNFKVWQCQNLLWPEGVRNLKCQTWMCQNRIVSEFFETGKCQNYINPEGVRIWMCQNRKVSEFSRTGKCQMSELLKSWKCQNLKVSEFLKSC